MSVVPSEEMVIPAVGTNSGTQLAFRARSLLRLTRPHQWLKNVLLVLPALAGHQQIRSELLDRVALGFVAFSCLASVTYIYNDFRDIARDRLHPTKRRRPLAAGEVGPAGAIVLTLLLGTAAVAAAWSLPTRFTLLLCLYAATSLLYSSVLKRRLLVDVVTLSALYTLRVLAGAALVGIPLSAWFLPFSVFLFLSLALAKRVTELVHTAGDATVKLNGRAYMAVDVQVLTSLGIAASASSSLVYCLYVTSQDVLRLYHTPDLLWIGLPLFIYWQARIWIFAVRGTLADDPVVFALRDRVSFLVTGAFLLTVWLAA